MREINKGDQLNVVFKGSGILGNFLDKTKFRNVHDGIYAFKP